MKKLIKSADKGNVDAQYQLGNKYYMGVGVKQDFDEADHWFEKASSQGHYAAKLYLRIGRKDSIS